MDWKLDMVWRYEAVACAPDGEAQLNKTFQNLGQIDLFVVCSMEM